MTLKSETRRPGMQAGRYCWNCRAALESDSAGNRCASCTPTPVSPAAKLLGAQRRAQAAALERAVRDIASSIRRLESRIDKWQQRRE